MLHPRNVAQIATSAGYADQYDVESEDHSDPPPKCSLNPHTAGAGSTTSSCFCSLHMVLSVSEIHEVCRSVYAFEFVLLNMAWNKTIIGLEWGKYIGYEYGSRYICFVFPFIGFEKTQTGHASFTDEETGGCCVAVVQMKRTLSPFPWLCWTRWINQKHV